VKEPVQHVCSFGECAEFAGHFLSPPGSDGLRNGPMVGACSAHKEHLPDLLQAKLRERATDISARARQAEGRLL